MFCLILILLQVLSAQVEGVFRLHVDLNKNKRLEHQTLVAQSPNECIKFQLSLNFKELLLIFICFIVILFYD